MVNQDENRLEKHKGFEYEAEENLLLDRIYEARRDAVNRDQEKTTWGRQTSQPAHPPQDRLATLFFSTCNKRQVAARGKEQVNSYRPLTDPGDPALSARQRAGMVVGVALGAVQVAIRLRREP
jgi:hypothetical protein